MTDAIGTERPTEGRVLDLAPRMSPEAIDRLEQAAREVARSSAAGVADVTTGTVRLTKDAEDAGGVLEQIDEWDDAERPGLWKIVPASLTDPGVLRHRRAVFLNASAFHAARSPVYLWRVAGVAALGARVGLRDAWSYVFATEYGELADKVRRTGAGAEHIADLRADRRKTAAERRRDPVTVYAATAATTYVAVLVAIGQVWGLIVACPALLPLFGVLYALGWRELARRSGDGESFRILDGEALVDDAPVNDERIVAALREIKLLTADQGIRPLGLPQTDKNGNTEIAFKLPPGVIVQALDKKRDQFAGALSIPTEQIDITQGRTPNDVLLWIAPKVPFSGPAPVSPLVNADRWDIWKGVPFGRNRKGGHRTLQVLWSSMLFGGAQGYGKTGAMYIPAAAGVLDPNCRILLADFKGGADWEELEGIAHRAIIGADPASVEAFVELIDELIEEMDNRFAKIRAMPKRERPDMRLTPEMAEAHGMPVLMLLVDEIQEAFGVLLTREKGAQEFAAVVEKLARLIRRGRACGLIIVAAAQRPDAKSVPTAFRDVILKRYSVHTVDDTSSDMILGDGAAKRGYTAAGLGKIGVGILAEEAGAEKIQPDRITPQAFEEICIRGRALRIAAGTLTGHAASGLLSAVGILAQIKAAFDTAGVDELGSADIARLLADRDPIAGWAQRAGESDRAWSSRVGGRLGQEIGAALDGTGKSLDRVKVTTLTGTEGRGIRRSDLNAVLGG